MAKGKKQEDPNKVAQRKAERVAFVQANPNLAPEVARQRFYVQTRAAELESAGKPVDRAALREKFQTGGVTREGFYTPGDVSRFNAASNGSSLADSKSAVVPPVVSNALVVPSATPSPSVTKPTGVKTPSSSYQAPQTTTSLGQVVNTAPSGTLAASKNNAGPNVRAGVGTRRVDNSTMASGVPQIAGVTWRSQADLPDAVITSPQQVPTPVKSRTQIKLSGKGGQNLAAWRANQDKWDREEFAADRLVNTGLVMGAETIGAIAGSLGGPGGSVAGAALAAGLAYNLTNRMSNWRSDGRYQGDTTLGGAAKVSAISGIAGGATLGVMKAVPKVAPVWNRVQNWANDVRVAAPAPKALEQTTGRAFGGAPGQVIETNLGKIPTRSMAIPGEQPFKPFAETVETKAGNKVKDKVVNLVRRNKVQEATPVAAPKSSPTILPAEPVAPKFTPEITRDSGLVIPATTSRTPASERSPVLQDALDKVLGKPAVQEPVSLGDSKAATAKAMAEDGVEELTPRQIAARKGVATKKAKKDAAIKLQQQNVEVKKPDTVPAAKTEPVPNVTPEPAVSSASNKLARKPFETNAQYDSRMRAETLKNSGAVTKIDAGMDLPRLTGKNKVVGQVEAGMSRSNRLSFIDDMSGEPRPKFGVVQGESPERLAMMRNHPAFTSKLPESPANLAEVKAPRMRDRFADINAAGEFDAMTPQGFPMSEPGETVRQFNERVNRFQAAKGKPMVSQEGNYPVSGAAPEAPTQAPKSLTGNVEPKRPSVNKFGQRLKSGAKINPETGEFHNVKIDPSTGEEAFVMPRVKGQQKTNAEKQAAKRLNQKVAVEVKQVPEAEKGVFTVAGQTIEGTKIVLPRGVSGTGKFVGENIPSDSSLLRMTSEERVAFAQANPKMDIEGWASKNLSPDEQQLFKNLREAQGTRASRRVAEPVKGKRAMKPGSELAAYEQRYTEILTNQGEINKVSFMRSKQQVALEREIENAFGTDAMVALRNRFATAADSIPTTGVDVSPAPASFSEVLPSQLRQELPVKPGGNLREQAAQLFNKQGLLKGKTGPGRARLWQQVKESAWFRELVAKEPTFANYLVEQNADLAAGYRANSLSQGIGGPRTPRLAGQEKYAGKLTEEQAAAQIAREELRTANAATSTGAMAEARDARRATSQLFPGEDAAFGQINQARIARETGVSLTPEQQSVLKDFGVLDPSGSLQMTYSDAASGFRELTRPIPRGARVSAELSNEVTVARKQSFYDQFGEAPSKDKANSKGWMKDQWLQKKDEFMGTLMDAPSTSSFLPSDPFSTRVDPNLVDPNMPRRPEAIENASVWRENQQKAAAKAAKQAEAQAELTAKTQAAREAGLLKEPNIDDFLNPRPARNVPPPSLEQMKQRFLIEEQTRREGLARAAAKAKAASFEVKATDPFEQVGKFNPQTGLYESDIVLPSGSVTRVQTRIGVGPPEPKFKFFVEERTFTRLNQNESPKMTAAEAERLMTDFKETEIANQREILKDWMSGD